jgi:speckle-type POZ protein
MEITSRLRSGALNSGVLDAKFRNYSTLPSGVEQAVCTPPVELGIYQWTVKVCPGGDKQDCQDHFSCFLCSFNEQEVTVSATIRIMSRSGIHQVAGQFHGEKMLRKGSGFGFNRLITQRELIDESKDLLADNTLHLRVVIHEVISKHPSASKYVQDSSHLYSEFSTSSYVQRGFESYGSIYPCDVQIATATGVIGGIEAHKCILALRSPVFRAMFKAGMKETSAGTIEIIDFPAPVVRAFVSFLYEDRCAKSVLEEHAVQLLAIADKYQVPALTTVCERFLTRALCAGNVVELLVLAENCSMAELRAEALAYLRSNSAAVLEKGNFQDLSASAVKDVVKTLTTK